MSTPPPASPGRSPAAEFPPDAVPSHPVGSFDSHKATNVTDAVKEMKDSKMKLARTLIMVAAAIVGVALALLAGFLWTPVGGLIIGGLAWFILTNAITPIVEKLMEKHYHPKPPSTVDLPTA